MTIKMFKMKQKGLYELVMDNGKVYSFYEEIILKYELLLKKDISDDMLPEIEAYNNECDVYYVALKALKSRFKSSWELRKMLLSKEYPSSSVDMAI